MELTSRRRLALEAGRSIHEAFAKYNENFGRITRRARQRFETRDWRGAEKDFVERLELYTKSVERSIAALTRQFGALATDREFWTEVKHSFGERVSGIADGAFCKTYFNSIGRRLFHTVGADPRTEFLDIRFNVRDAQRFALDHRSYLNWGAIEPVIAALLADFSFDPGAADPAADTRRIAEALRRHAVAHADGEELMRLDFLPAVFYQSSGAYLIGQAFWPQCSAPIVIAFGHPDAGIRVEQVMMDVDDISILFGFTRSYFFVDLEPVEGAIHFIHTLLPHKPIDELYTVLGRVRQGKTERYRQFTTHLASSQDSFVPAAGDRGLVMIVFTLPSYDLVFKVIRDRFGYPKNTSRDEVMAKYQLVFKHDRAGRLIDTQEFTHIGFPLSRFDREVLEELQQEAAESTRIDGDQIVIRHLYVERRLRPLNLFLRECTPEAGRAAVIEYGNAIRDLAQTNVFPGDLLLKNFGVTRHGRVIFYDYDELCLVTECNFREVPAARYEEDEMRQEAWFYVNGSDVFPEEFLRFLAMPGDCRDAFLSHHAELLTVAWWQRMKEYHLRGRSEAREGNARGDARPSGLRAARDA